MATSTIKTGLRLVKLDSNDFTWNSSYAAFACSKANSAIKSGLSTVIGYLVNGNTTYIMYSVAVYPNVNNTHVIVSGWNAKTGVNITSEEGTEGFSVYAIGY